MSAQLASTTPAGASAAAGGDRLAAVDVLRGLSVAGMLLVNNPGSWGAIFPPLRHAEWHGWTPTDLVFPFFLFTVGIAIHLSARRPGGTTSVRSILWRALLIVSIGLALNAFPFYTAGPLSGEGGASMSDRIIDRFANLRFSGVLQRIGLVYAAAALLARWLSSRKLGAVIVALLVGYWAAMTLVPVPDSGVRGALLLDEPARTLAAWTDRAVLGARHIYKGARTWDPEGVLSTIPAIATALFGVLAGRRLSGTDDLTRRLIDLFAAGALLCVVGQIWSWVFPINKNLWSSSYAVFTAGVACLVLATCSWLLDTHRTARWLRPFEVFGTNALLAFVGSGVMARLTDSMIHVRTANGDKPLHVAIYRQLTAAGLPAEVASLLYAIVFVLIWLLLLTPLHRRRIFLRV